MRKPNHAEVTATTIGPFDTWPGWYCPNHPLGDALANDAVEPVCWGCGALKPDERSEWEARKAMLPITVVILPPESKDLS